MGSRILISHSICSKNLYVFCFFACFILTDRANIMFAQKQNNALLRDVNLDMLNITSNLDGIRIYLASHNLKIKITNHKWTNAYFYLRVQGNSIHAPKFSRIDNETRSISLNKFLPTGNYTAQLYMFYGNYNSSNFDEDMSSPTFNDPISIFDVHITSDVNLKYEWMVKNPRSLLNFSKYPFVESIYERNDFSLKTSHRKPICIDENRILVVGDSHSRCLMNSMIQLKNESCEILSEKNICYDERIHYKVMRWPNVTDEFLELVKEYDVVLFAFGQWPLAGWSNIPKGFVWSLEYFEDRFRHFVSNISDARRYTKFVTRTINYNKFTFMNTWGGNRDFRIPPIIESYNDLIRSLAKELSLDLIDFEFLIRPLFDEGEHYDQKVGKALGLYAAMQMCDIIKS